MRQIKFRGKCLHCDKWVYGNLVDFGEDKIPEIHGFDPYREGSLSWREINVERPTIGQFTGLLDKNGKEIYEGDIVMFVHTTGRFVCKNICEVIYDGEFCSAFSVKLNDTWKIPFSLEFPAKLVEVIGNIHDKEFL